MASYSQGGGFYAASLRTQDHGNADQNGEGRHAHISRFSSDAQSSRSGLKTHHRKRPGRGAPRSLRSGPRIGVFVFLVLCLVSITIIGGDYLFSILRNRTGGHGAFRSHDFLEKQEGSNLFLFWNGRSKPARSTKVNTDWEDDLDHDNYYHDGKKKRALQFGKAFVQKEELVDRDSRYWDKDDRIRDRDLDYEDAGSGTSNANDDAGQQNQRELSRIARRRNENVRRHGELYDDDSVAKQYKSHDSIWESEPNTKQAVAGKRTASGSGGLYNERGRKELRIYEEQLEAALKHELDSSRAKHASGFDVNHEQRDGDGGTHTHSQSNDEVDAFSANANKQNLTEPDRIEESFLEDDGDDEYADTVSEDDEFKLLENEDPHMGVEEVEGLPDDSSGARGADNLAKMKVTSKALNGVRTPDTVSKKNEDGMRQQSSRKTRRRRHAGNPCEIDFLETTEGLQEPETAPRFHNFSLKYVDSEYSQGIAGWEPRFAGHQTLVQRNQSFKAEDKTIHCGFVEAADPPQTSGFDLAEEDVQYLRTCRIAVSSCIFGSSDNVRSPRNRKLTGSFKKDVCFVMFVDQSTLEVMQQEGQQLDEKGYLGPWKVMVVKNMPYTDARRVGKIPKFLTHRLFPAARYSIWLDSKLRLQNDPVLILEHFLWRGGYEYAISNHYDRHCVWEEVQQNKKLNKYNHTAIDEQFAFYQADGLTRFNASDPKKLLPSNVPEGSFIIRAHTPMSNLFSCLWFNEVDRFTSRDQLSFAYTYMKFVRTNPDKHFHLNMFKDCERKSIAKLFRHRKNTSVSIENHVHEEVVQ